MGYRSSTSKSLWSLIHASTHQYQSEILSLDSLIEKTFKNKKPFLTSPSPWLDYINGIHSGVIGLVVGWLLVGWLVLYECTE